MLQKLLYEDFSRYWVCNILYGKTQLFAENNCRSVKRFKFVALNKNIKENKLIYYNKISPKFYAFAKFCTN